MKRKKRDEEDSGLKSTRESDGGGPTPNAQYGVVAGNRSIGTPH
ncbi:uncharacterized protein G2W53_043838 [Senna tora]|uniref:Uncharacterized protein n=1 Tax=Senna tora TaxID=362788 RepID=A0A834W0J0_9FABA|nr:uncharacterized protein G2W53_043838 [Senna tora]